MKLIIATSVWQRYPLTEIVFEYYQKLKHSFDLVHRHHSIELLCVVSSDQACDIAKKYGWKFFPYKNNPLTHKMTALFAQARSLNADAVLFINSDNLLCSNLIMHYFNWYYEGTQTLVGMKDIYFYSAEHDKTVYFEGYKKKHQSTGAGRFFSKTVLDKINWQPWGNQKADKSLDTICSEHLRRKGIKEEAFCMHEANGICVDIKTDTNITEWNRVEGSFNDKVVDNSVLYNVFGEEMEKIRISYFKEGKNMKSEI